MADGTRKTLEQEIAGYRAEAQRAERNISELARERDRTISELQQATQQYVSALEEVKIRDATIGDLQRSIQEGEGRLRQQQALYEAVRSDRNLYSKNLLEAQAEVAELKRRFKIATHQIEQARCRSCWRGSVLFAGCLAAAWGLALGALCARARAARGAAACSASLSLVSRSDRSTALLLSLLSLRSSRRRSAPRTSASSRSTSTT